MIYTHPCTSGAPQSYIDIYMLTLFIAMNNVRYSFYTSSWIRALDGVASTKQLAGNLELDDFRAFVSSAICIARPARDAQ